MSHVVIRGIPFATRLRAAKGGAKQLLEHDRARAKKFLAGKSHHTPLNAHYSEIPAFSPMILLTDWSGT
jgi:hypothetical protein